MNKVENMHIRDIIEMTNLYVTPQSFIEIWKPSKPGSIMKSALECFEENPRLVYELLKDELKLYKFLVEHNDEINKPRFIMQMLINYKERLKKSASLETKEVENIKEGIQGIRKLLRGMDNTFIFYNVDDNSDRIWSLTIINSKEELEGIDRKNKNTNMERLRQLQKDSNLTNIIQLLCLSDVEDIISFEKQIGSELRYLIEYNAILDENGQLPPSIEREYLSKLIDELERDKFIDEMTRILELHIEEINFDKLLLCSAYRYIQELELENIQPDHIYVVKTILDIIKKHIRKNVKINMSDNESYSLKDLERDLKRFVGKERVTYISKEYSNKIIDALVAGEITLDNLGKQNVNAISIEPIVLTKILQGNPNNYIFFLKQEKCQYDKNTIIKDIINTQKCSAYLLQLLCKKTDITNQEICGLFERSIISISDLKNIREHSGTIITNAQLFEKYKKYKQKADQGQEAEIERIQLERYALAYRNTELMGKEENEVHKKAEEFITEVGDEIDSPDIMQLYKFNIIPLKVSVEWGGEDIVEQLLESESLKPADAKYLKNEGLLNEHVLERLFKKCIQMSYSYQVSLVYAVFDGQTLEEQEIRERLAQYYHIENGIINPTGKAYSGKKRNSRSSQEEVKERTIKMRDPGAKYNLLASIDNDVKIEEGIIDGHIIFHYPNIEDGTVLIEKLHRITSNKTTGLIEIRADNESATYVLSEEEFIKIRSQLIQDGKVDRTQLTQRWWITRDPEHWIPHTGTRGWEEALKQRFLIDAENKRYTTEDLEKIQQLIEKSIESKKIEER